MLCCLAAFCFLLSAKKHERTNLRVLRFLTLQAGYVARRAHHAVRGRGRHRARPPAHTPRAKTPKHSFLFFFFDCAFQGGYVTLRGWLTTPSAAEAGAALFRLPAVAAPNRTEEWRVVLKARWPPLYRTAVICNNTNTVNITLPRRLAAALKTSPSHSSPPTQDVARHIIVSPSPDSTARTLLPPAEKRWLPLHGFSSHLLPFHAPFPGRGPPHHSLPLARRHCADSFAARREALAAAARLRLLTPLTLHNLPRM